MYPSLNFVALGQHFEFFKYACCHHSHRNDWTFMSIVPDFRKILDSAPFSRGQINIYILQYPRRLPPSRPYISFTLTQISIFTLADLLWMPWMRLSEVNLIPEGRLSDWVAVHLKQTTTAGLDQSFSTRKQPVSKANTLPPYTRWPMVALYGPLHKVRSCVLPQRQVTQWLRWRGWRG